MEVNYQPLLNQSCRLPDCAGITDHEGWCSVCQNVNFVPVQYGFAVRMTLDDEPLSEKDKADIVTLLEELCPKNGLVGTTGLTKS